MTTPVQQALAAGQSIWYDGIRRSLLTSGELEHMVTKKGLRGMTSNPSIFDAAIAGSSDYADAIAELRRSGPSDAKSAYESLAIADIRGAADVFRHVYDESGGGIDKIASVASVFVSRLDSAVEPRLDRSYAGKVAIANAKVVDEHQEPRPARGARPAGDRRRAKVRRRVSRSSVFGGARPRR